MSIKFEMPKDISSIIKVVGVGGGGGNAVNHMYKQGITGVDFIICNTDSQALENSPIPNKVQLGASLTEGMGAGAQSEVGKNAAIESIDDIKALLGTNTKMLFITAGMGGGTGTGASPIIAKAAQELGILTVAIVTTPFVFEGKKRKEQADLGLNELKNYVDAYLVISNDKIKDIFGSLPLPEAFAKADNILSTAAKGIAEIITVPGYINVDFKDVNTTMKNSGVAIMGSAIAEGPNRAQEAVDGALSSPLLKDNEIEGARYILLNITSSHQNPVTMDEITIITDFIQGQAGASADLIWGNCIDENYAENLSVTIIATGFKTDEQRVKEKDEVKVYQKLEVEEVIKPVFYKSANKIKEEATEIPLIQKPKPLSSKMITNQPSLFELNASESNQSENKVIFHLEDDAVAPKAVHDTDDMKMIVVENEIEIQSATAPEPISKVEETQVQQIEIPEEEELNLEDTERKMQQARERIRQFKENSLRSQSPNEMMELENVPAYLRKSKTAPNEVPHSSSSAISRFSIINNENGEAEIRTNNSFLHGNVD